MFLLNDTKEENMDRTVLLNPGPVNVSKRVETALLRGDLCHREQEFTGLMDSIRKKLLRAFNIEKDYTAVLLSGSGTAALEMAVSSSLSPDKSMLVIENGVYGERIGKIAECYKLNKHVLHYPWDRPPDLQEVEKALQTHPEIEVVAMVHHETTTGQINPVQEVGRQARRYKKKFLVDAISSLAGEAVDFDRFNIDICVGTANKCIQGVPGVSFVLFRKSEADRLKSIPRRSVYMNLPAYYEAQEKGGVLFTPAVQVHYALDEALSELLEETVAARIQRYRAAATLLRKGFSRIGLQFLISEEFRSNTLTALKLPDGVSYSNLHDRLKEEGFIIYAGQGNFSDSIFRVANMGDIRLEEFERFLHALAEYLTQTANCKG